MPRRRLALLTLLALPLLPLPALPRRAPAVDYPIVTPGPTFSFPRDHGAHPAFRSEWWYVTGWLQDQAQRPLGFQVTFFRTRPDIADDNPSAFAPRQILFAHAALSDPGLGRLRHDQRLARAGFGLAAASESDTDLVLDDWRMRRLADGSFTTQVAGDGFALDLTLTPTAALLAEGDGGYSRKGPLPEQASYYYSLPHLQVAGSVLEDGARRKVTGEAWLDREWSSTLLPPGAVGWDWLGVNCDDGGALMLFQIRAADGHALWAGGSWRDGAGQLVTLRPDQLRFDAGRLWRSPRSLAANPVAPTVSVTLPGGVRAFQVQPLFDDQELDSRSGGGPVYWEGAMRVLENGQAIGRGYLELTGYVAPLTW